MDDKSLTDENKEDIRQEALKRAFDSLYFQEQEPSKSGITEPLFSQSENFTSSKDYDPNHESHKADTKDKKTDTKLKKKFARYFFRVLAAQLIVMNMVFISVGFKWLEFSDLALNLYMTGTLIEVFGIVLVMVKYLFSNKK